jgi:hypothetical protein
MTFDKVGQWRDNSIIMSLESVGAEVDYLDQDHVVARFQPRLSRTPLLDDEITDLLSSTNLARL